MLLEHMNLGTCKGRRIRHHWDEDMLHCCRARDATRGVAVGYNRAEEDKKDRSSHTLEEEELVRCLSEEEDV